MTYSSMSLDCSYKACRIALYFSNELPFMFRFPKDKVKRQAWKAALRRKEFEPNDRSVICSCHFKPEDFDMTGQTTRIKEGVIPSVFIFSDHLSKVSVVGKLFLDK